MERVKRALALYTNYFLLRRTPTLVYSVERSGSVALLHSLQSHGVFAIGAHYFSFEKPELSPEKSGQQRISGSAAWASKHIVAKRKPAKVISMVRSPIDNMLSTFAREYYGEQASGHAESIRKPSPKEISDDFRQNYLDSNRYQHPLTWFETEFRQTLGIDIYQHPFDKQRRFARFREEAYDVLVLGTELDDEVKSQLVSDFVGIANFEISDASLASQTSASNKQNRLPPGKPGKHTAYAEKYQTLKQQVQIPMEYLDAIVDSCYVQHFFSEEDREAIRLKYSGEPSRREGKTVL